MDKTDYITVTWGMAGYFAVHMYWNEEFGPKSGFWEPWNTGIGRYATYHEAEQEAKDWTEAEEIEFRSGHDEGPKRQDVTEQLREIFPGIKEIDLG